MSAILIFITDNVNIKAFNARRSRIVFFLPTTAPSPPIPHAPCLLQLVLVSWHSVCIVWANGVDRCFYRRTAVQVRLSRPSRLFHSDVRILGLGEPSRNLFLRLLPLPLSPIFFCL